GSLVKRIRRLLYPKGPNRAWPPLFGSVVLIVIAAVALAAWQSEPPQQSFVAAQQQTDRAETSPYVKWLNEDVAYIITDEERAAFQKLMTKEQREKFIEQFWLRRDPTPGTGENELKEEHYRRIGYANKRFRTSGRPGWQTDRGRMYIPYGPPDEIESHPSGGGQTVYPFEIWKYRYVEGIGNNVSFTFVDRTRTGDYRLAPGNAR
ncbi:MAG: GWxTD domain-containing protein, partial [Bryobacteraceae bacterium]